MQIFCQFVLPIFWHHSRGEKPYFDKLPNHSGLKSHCQITVEIWLRRLELDVKVSSVDPNILTICSPEVMVEFVCSGMRWHQLVATSTLSPSSANVMSQSSSRSRSTHHWISKSLKLTNFKVIFLAPGLTVTWSPVNRITTSIARSKACLRKHREQLVKALKTEKCNNIFFLSDINLDINMIVDLLKEKVHKKNLVAIQYWSPWGTFKAVLIALASKLNKIRTSKRPFETLIPWVSKIVSNEIFCKSFWKWRKALDPIWAWCALGENAAKGLVI